MKNILVVLTEIFIFNLCLAQKTDVITINMSKPLAKIQPTMWGLFFEDINFAADGGIYAELIKNRSFEFDEPLMGWKLTSWDNNIGRIFILRDEKKIMPTISGCKLILRMQSLELLMRVSAA